MNKEQVKDKIKLHVNKYKSLNHFSNIKENKIFVQYINDYYESTSLSNCSFSEKVWSLMNDDYVHHCPVCGIKCSFRNFNVGYSKYCKEHGIRIGSCNSIKKKRERSPEELIIKICEQCGKEFSYTKRKLNKFYKRFCSKSCSATYIQRTRSKEDKIKIAKKIKRTNLKKYGSEYVVNSIYTRKKTKEKLGVEYSFQLKYVLNKSKESLLKNTGYAYPSQNPKTIKKIIDTKNKRYGDLLIPMSKFKEYKMPSGRIVKVQGNEGKALDILIEKYDEKDIIIGRKNIENEIGKIFYTCDNEKVHIYYPDIYIKSKHKIYEVKSNFTFNIHKDINIKKKDACLDKGLLFEFFIID